ncbi:MAG TPA: NAD(P)-dependent oxidoreductase [Anaerolineales bacterium]|nr:NAD(P)-dependent oxidoreductase [Anaerolineales bacterium]
MRNQPSTSNPGKIVSVTGSSGCLGDSLLKQLHSRGYQINALFRGISKASQAWNSKHVNIIYGQLNDQEALKKLMKDAYAIFHCAAYLGKGKKEQSYQTNVKGTENLLIAAAEAGVRLFIYVSSISVYRATSPDLNAKLSEDSPPVFTPLLNPYSRTKLEGEIVVKNLCTKYGLSYLIMRPTNVYGLLSKPWFIQIVQYLNTSPIIFGRSEMDFVYVDDVSRAMIKALEKPDSWNQDFNIGHEMITLVEYLSKICKLINKTRLRIPPILDRIICKGIDNLYLLITHSYPSVSFSTTVKYPHKKAKQVFGYSPDINLDIGMMKMKEELYQKKFDAEKQSNYHENHSATERNTNN